MNLLLDTHAFLRWVEGDGDLGASAVSAVSDPENAVSVSIASCWEISVKVRLGKLRVGQRLDRFLPEQLRVNDFTLLGIELAHVIRVSDLPFHHRDPFDRLLVAQALEEDLAIVSADRVFRKYGVGVIW